MPRHAANATRSASPRAAPRAPAPSRRSRDGARPSAAGSRGPPGRARRGSSASRRAARRRRVSRSRRRRGRGVRADRRVAARVERPHDRALGRQARRGVAVGRATARPRARRSSPARASSARRPGRAPGTIASASSGAPLVAAPEPLEPGAREHDRVEVALRELAAGACRRCRAARRTRGRAAARAAARGGAGSPCRRARPRRSSSSEPAPQSASRGSARSGTPTIASPSGSSPGTSFAECTARSTRRASSASSISFTKRDLSPSRRAVARRRRS